MPVSSYGLFFSRDVLAMAFIFSLPPIVAPRIKAAVDDGTLPLTAAQANLATRLTTPVISQLFTTPLHLLGLSVYVRRADMYLMNRGDAVAATWLCRGETSRGNAAAATRIVCRDESRRTPRPRRA